MADQSYFMGLDGFVWFTGVVEDRNDPEALGRVRVRCVGFHSDSVVDLPTGDLPWAHVMHPVTDPAMHGMGNSPSFLVEGSYVIGFFRDAVERQQPIIIGSLPGSPIQPADPKEGFNDPRGKKSKQPNYAYDPAYGPYPVDGNTYKMKSGHRYAETDTNRLAQGEASETHQSLINRRLMRLHGDPDGFVDPKDGVTKTGNGVPTSIAPFLDQVDPSKSSPEKRGFWEEPHPKGSPETASPYVTSQYPYNHVHESESGHIHEIDDSPGAERLMTQHKSGTFEELHANGDKVVKVIGDNYEIIVGSSNLFVNGNINITTNGTVRELITGDYHLEVGGDYSMKIGGNVRTKIGAKDGGGNLMEEIRGNYGFDIAGDYIGSVGPKSKAGSGDGEYILTIVGDETHTVGGEQRHIVSGDISFTGDSAMAITIDEDYVVKTVSGIVSIQSGTAYIMKSKTAMIIESELNIDMDSQTFTEIHAGDAFDVLAGTVVQIRSGGGTPTASLQIELNPAVDILNLNSGYLDPEDLDSGYL
jgi:hypothetical protein